MHKKSFSGCLCTGHPIFMLPATVYNQFKKWALGQLFFCVVFLDCFVFLWGWELCMNVTNIAVYFMR